MTIPWDDFYAFDGPRTPAIFDESSFFSQNVRVQVVINAYEPPYEFPRLYLKRLFPQLRYHHETVNVERLARDYARRLSSRKVDPATVHAIIAELFGALGRSSGDVRLFQGLLSQHLTDTLNSDVYHGRPHNLFPSRRKFIVLAFFAKATRSRELATTLAQFFLANQHTIVGKAYVLDGCEHAKYLGAWGLAFLDIKDLLTPIELSGCLESLARRLPEIIDSRDHIRYRDNRWHDLIRMMEALTPIIEDYPYLDVNWNPRGRKRRPLMYDVPRASSMPAPMVRHQPIYPLRPPPHLIAPVGPYGYGRYSPVPSLDMMPVGGYGEDDPINFVQEEIEDLSVRQEHLGVRQEHLEERVGRVERIAEHIGVY